MNGEDFGRGLALIALGIMFLGALVWVMDQGRPSYEEEKPKALEDESRIRIEKSFVSGNKTGWYTKNATAAPTPDFEERLLKVLSECLDLKEVRTSEEGNR